ncbi:MAG TPA: DUF1697 domain-containing protein [Verrucomicrobiae bacterium]|nr:DUF1697 domain-containing protein [Verrucomicrobiae bacterium]
MTRAGGARSGVAGRRVALLRGINVGTARRIAMADLRELFERLGYRDVRTLLNSGNVVFAGPAQGGAGEGARIEKAILERLKVATRVTVLSAKEVAEAVRAHPFGAIADDPARFLIMALRDSKAAARMKSLLDERWAPEALALGKRVAYLWCANGILDSPLWTAAGRAVGDAGTARNLSTMTKILELVGRVDPGRKARA